MFSSVGFIGTGNMGGALAKAVSAGGFQGRLLLSDTHAELAEQLRQTLRSAELSDNETIVKTCDAIFLAVKPQVMPLLLPTLRSALSERENPPLLITMAAGLSCARVCEMAGGSYPIIRIMPNTPVSIGCGVVLYCGLGATQEQTEAFQALLSAAGLLDAIPEALIDAASAVSGCGPAFVYLFIEALADGGVACGLPRDKALRYAAKTVEGAARMVQETGKHPGLLKDAVCSPGGTTIQGVRKLEQGGLRAAAMDAVIAAYEKTLSMK